MELTKDTLRKIDDVIPRYPEKRSAALMVIHLIQDELGSISNESCEWIAEKLEVQPINIRELITFYPMLRETPWGKKKSKKFCVKKSKVALKNQRNFTVKNRRNFALKIQRKIKRDFQFKKNR